MQTSWDLSEIYTSSDDPAIERDFDTCNTIIQNIETYRGRVAGLDSNELKSLIERLQELYQHFHKLGLYASLLESTNSGIDSITRFGKLVEERSTALLKRILFVDVERRQISDANWRKHRQSPVLAEYHLMLTHWQREAKHTLSETEEKILADKSLTSSITLNHLFDVTTDTLEVRLGENTITIDECTTLLKDPDPKNRKMAAFALHSALQANNKTTHAIYNALIHDKSITDKLRHYNYCEESRFDADDVDRKTVNAMIEAVESSSVVTDYYRLKKKLLGVDTLMWWDRYAPLPKPKAKFTIDQATTLVLEAFNQFSPTFKAIAQDIIASKHIDWLTSNTKRGGAFCAFGEQKKLPYILLSFTGTFDDVNTLAHEMGHAIHDVLAGRANQWFNVWPSLATAEIASTFGEELLFNAVMSDRKITKEDKISLLMQRIEGNIATIHRQVSMFQFEQKAHAKRAKTGELSKEELDNLWHETIKKPFGDSLEWTDEHRNFWMYIPHIFHTPFYVYSYAFAQLCTLALVQTYKTTPNPTAFVETYTKMLKAGGSQTPKEILAQAGLDITMPQFWRSGLSIVARDIADLERLA